MGSIGMEHLLQIKVKSKEAMVNQDLVKVINQIMILINNNQIKRTIKMIIVPLKEEERIKLPKKIKGDY